MSFTLKIAGALWSTVSFALYLVVTLILLFYVEATSLYIVKNDSKMGLDFFQWLFDHVTWETVPEVSAMIENSRSLYKKHPWWLKLHVLPQTTALLIGLFQLWAGSKENGKIPWHRRIGQIYIGCITAGVTGGLLLSTHTYGGLVAKLGFLGMVTGKQ